MASAVKPDHQQFDSALTSRDDETSLPEEPMQEFAQVFKRIWSKFPESCSVKFSLHHIFSSKLGIFQKVEHLNGLNVSHLNIVGDKVFHYNSENQHITVAHGDGSQWLMKLKVAPKIMHMSSGMLFLVNERSTDIEIFAAIGTFGRISTIHNAHEKHILSLCAIDKLLITAGSDCMIKVWDIDTGNQIITQKLKDQPYAIRYQDGIIASLEKSGLLSIWGLKQSATPLSGLNSLASQFSGGAFYSKLNTAILSLPEIVSVTSGPWVNFDRIAARQNEFGNLARVGSSGKYYCGGQLEGDWSCCNGFCGHTNNCNCSACMKLDVEARGLPRGYLVNRQGRSARAGINGNIYCGAKVLIGFGGDGWCGPTDGPQCRSCFILQQQWHTRYRDVSQAEYAPETDRIVARKNAAGKNARIGSSGKFYCGQDLNGQCYCCDGKCGTTNGCNWVSCMQLDVEVRNLPAGYLVNKIGNICRRGTTGKIYCGAMVLNQDPDCDGYCGPTKGPQWNECEILEEQWESRYGSITQEPEIEEDPESEVQASGTSLY